MAVSRVLAIIATVLLGVAFVLVLVSGADRKLVEECALLGLACLAGSHAA